MNMRDYRYWAKAAVAALGLVVLWFGVMPSGMAKTNIEERVEDTSLSTQVKLRILNDKQMDNTNINVDVHDSVVVLKGMVNTPFQRKRAASLAISVKGVHSVDNQLAITGAENRSNDNRLQKGLQNVDDDTLVTRVRFNLLKAGLMNGNKVKVKVLNKTVLLNGFVSTEGERSEAQRVAYKTSGVNKVINNLKVGK